MKWSNLADLRWKDLKKIDRADVLNRMGLEERSPMADFFTGLGLFAVGVLVGTGLGIIFAPKPGAEMRSQLGERVRRGTRRAEEFGQQMGAEVGSPAPGHIS
jgi:hypothetical protein